MSFHSFSCCWLPNLRNTNRIWPYSSSKSSKVSDLAVNWMRYFLLVINSNFGHISYRFWDNWRLKTENGLFGTPARENLLEFWDETYRAKTAGMGWKFHHPIFNCFWLIHPCDRRTDGQTDWIEHCFKSLPTQYRLYGRRFLPAGRYASAGNSDHNVSVCPSLPVLCQNEES